MMKIEKNVPISEARVKQSLASLPAANMEMGDSVFFDAAKPNYDREAKKLYIALGRNASIRTIREYCPNKGQVIIKGKRVWKLSNQKDTTQSIHVVNG